VIRNYANGVHCVGCGCVMIAGLIR